VEETGDFRALKISDFLTRAQLHRLELYDERLRPFGFEYSMMLPLRSPPWHERGFDLYRSRRDFSNRDRDVLDMLSPHLVRLIRNLELRRQIQSALAALDGGDVDQGIVLLDSNGHLDHATPLARSLLAKYFPAAGVSLPQTVAEWLAHSQCSLVRERGAHRIVVDRVGQRLLVREEPVEAAKVARLTPREQQVLEWVADGKTNAEIAQILVAAPGTVRKHLEHIYAKLGVHTHRRGRVHPRKSRGRRLGPVTLLRVGIVSRRLRWLPLPFSALRISRTAHESQSRRALETGANGLRDPTALPRNRLGKESRRPDSNWEPFITS
jgi:DNA-binding CsgD family transcriptional regulator